MNTFHLGIYGIVLKQKTILLVQKARGPYTGLLDLPGGTPEHGESIAQTLARELIEETGVVVKASSLFDNQSTKATYPESAKIMHHTGLLYLIDDYDDTMFTSRPHNEADDITGASWYSLHELQEKELSPFACHVIKVLKNNPILW